MDKKLLAVVIAVLLVGSAVGYSVSWFQMEELRRRISKLEGDVTELEEENEVARDVVDDLNSSLIELLRAHGQSDELYFFVQDPNFTMPLDRSVFWGVEAWNWNPDSVCEV